MIIEIFFVQLEITLTMQGFLQVWEGLLDFFFLGGGGGETNEDSEMPAFFLVGAGG